MTASSSADAVAAAATANYATEMQACLVCIQFSVGLIRFIKFAFRKSEIH